jgi:hypothetical protein
VISDTAPWSRSDQHGSQTPLSDEDFRIAMHAHERQILWTGALFSPVEMVVAGARGQLLAERAPRQAAHANLDSPTAAAEPDDDRRDPRHSPGAVFRGAWGGEAPHRGASEASARNQLHPKASPPQGASRVSQWWS